ncbi:ArsR/SmtB family transcription factor [Vulcanisaeta distributa]|uniref:Transcriptional regulator, ArsR family n=1 Tax=Vulcanisaeta distributa (strain DSM 14429 / JCM 11212 / NBRC 100878 / IC-017) TaxID=572478 RepID=E1QRC6_VULDI|nr:winged helix-turn-helix domain-containing protein [Vulcanisaeta distributa]ADN50623.1 transcriptional regulator, ArsR family [Vulcanisaeta distributa DSM 14429]
MIALGELIKSLIMPFLALLVGEMNDDASIMNNDRDHVSNDGVTDKMIHTCPMYARIRWLLVESRGGPIRSKILLLLRERPTNINRIAKELNMDYKTVKHHLELLEKNGLVKRLGLRYGDVYFIEDNAYKHWDELYVLIKESLKLSDNSNPQ